MPSPTDTYVLLRAFVDELARCGLREACTSPGSRSTPMVFSLVREARLRCFSHIDERAAGFFALGLAKASGTPAAVTCTSGTAAAELMPAVVEAHEARVPMIVLTCDRPPELREVGAGQTIDQVKLYGYAAKWYFEVDSHEATPERLHWMRRLACRAFAEAVEGRPGVVHLNFTLREPLVVEQPLPPDETGRSDGHPILIRRASPGAGIAAGRVAELAGPAARGVVVAGRFERHAALRRVAPEFCERAGFVLLAEPLSGARSGRTAVAHYDALLRDRDFAARQRPDVVIRVGDLPTSKALREWLAGLADAHQVAIDPEGSWSDPDGAVAEWLVDDPAAALRAAMAAAPTVTAVPTGSEGDGQTAWLESWRSADERAAQAIEAELAAGLSEPTVAAELGRLLPAQATLFVASSMPVRDVETFWPVLEQPPRVLCNRGANGIDGTVSSAFGAAAVATGAPVVLLIGDVALAHDIGGLLAAGRLGLKLTIVLLDNGGGGIFDFLAVADAPMGREAGPHALPGAGEPRDLFTEHVSTPTGLDFASAAALYGLSHERVEDLHGLRAALERALASERSALIEVPGDRRRNVATHRRVWERVSRALSG